MLRSPSTSSNSNDKASVGTHAQNAALAASRITAGSRASKYIGVTASQLKQRVKPSNATTTVSSASDVAPNGQTTPSKIKPTLGSGLKKPQDIRFTTFTICYTNSSK